MESSDHRFDLGFQSTAFPKIGTAADWHDGQFAHNTHAQSLGRLPLACRANQSLSRLIALSFGMFLVRLIALAVRARPLKRLCQVRSDLLWRLQRFKIGSAFEVSEALPLHRIDLGTKAVAVIDVVAKLHDAIGCRPGRDIDPVVLLRHSFR